MNKFFNGDGRFVNTVLGVTSVLVTIGICASVALAVRTAGHLGAISAKLEALEIYYDDSKTMMGALRILIGDNHVQIRSEMADLEARLDQLENQ